MPIFEYTCDHCNYKFDKLVVHRGTKVSCPLCQGDVKKLMSTFAVGGHTKAAGNLPNVPGMPGGTTCTNC